MSARCAHTSKNFLKHLGSNSGSVDSIVARKCLDEVPWDRVAVWVDSVLAYRYQPVFVVAEKQRCVSLLRAKVAQVGLHSHLVGTGVAEPLVSPQPADS